MRCYISAWYSYFQGCMFTGIMHSSLIWLRDDSRAEEWVSSLVKWFAASPMCPLEHYANYKYFLFVCYVISAAQWQRSFPGIQKYKLLNKQGIHILSFGEVISFLLYPSLQFAHHRHQGFSIYLIIKVVTLCLNSLYVHFTISVNTKF